MKKILITTDFSANSVSGLLFATHIASQINAELTLLHVQTLIKPTSWGQVSFEEYKEAETEKRHQELLDFVKDVFHKAGIATDKFTIKYAVEDHASPSQAILAYAHAQAMDYICTSTQGAGTLKKIMGSNTSALIGTSDIPVISVPADYILKPISHLLYASDLKNLEAELNKVVDFAKPFEAEVELLHFNTIAESLDEANVQASIQKFSNYAVKVHLESPDYVKSLVAHIKEAIAKSDTSMLVMFTEQNRTFFQKIFMASKTMDYAFASTVPLLTFKK